MSRSSIVSACALVLVIGCSREPIPLRPDAGDAGVEGDTGTRPLRLLGATPPRGPHTGGNRVIVQGAGFVEGRTRLVIDDIVVPEDRVTVTAPGRLSIVMPPHPPGSVAFTVGVGSSEATLSDVYQYEALAVDPAVGSTDGGLRVTVYGSGADYREGDAILFGGTPCSEVVIVSAEEANCRVPSSMSAASVDVVLMRDDIARITAPEAFEYIDTAFTTGSISGEAIDGMLDVSVLGATGPVEDAVVLVTGSPAGEVRGRTDATGRVLLSAPMLRGPVSVHVGHVCYSRTSLAGVNARRLSIPLRLHHYDDTREGCPGRGEPGRLSPGTPDGRARALVQFVAGEEFPTPTREWIGVPEPRPGTRRVLYVWSLLGPSFDETYLRFLEADWDPVRQGFVADLGTRSGTAAICALAGIEPNTVTDPEECTRVDGDCLPDYERARMLERFVVGCSTTVVVPPAGTSREALIEMNGRLTEALTVTAQPLPSLSVLTADSATTVRTELTPDSEVLLARDFILLTEVDEHGIPRQRSASTPFTARFGRRPALPFVAPSGMEPLLVVGWADRSAAYVPALFGMTYEVTPIGVPRFIAPASLGAARPSDPIRFEIDGTVRADLIQLRVVPDGYAFGGTIPEWYVFAPGDTPEVVLPAAAEPELALPAALYGFNIDATRFERFDFNHWSFLEVAREIPTHLSSNQIYARFEGSTP